MEYQILCVGKIKDVYYREAINEYCGQINKTKHTIEIVEFPDEKIPEKLSERNKEIFLEKECSKLKSKITNKDYVIALCIEGKEIKSIQHKQQIIKAEESGYERITYIIGGSLGIAESIKERANLKLSFSKMTFPHQMMRMVLCEEIATNII